MRGLGRDKWQRLRYRTGAELPVGAGVGWGRGGGLGWSPGPGEGGRQEAA